MYFVFNTSSLFFEVTNRNHFITVNPLTFGLGDCRVGGKKGEFESARNQNHTMILER
jgi:hypothetical protein